jgi:potassium efflux system protein
VKPVADRTVGSVTGGVVLALALAGALLWTGQLAAEEPPALAPTPTPTPAPTPIAAAEISDQSMAVDALLHRVARTAQIGDDFDKITSEFDQERHDIDALAAETSRRLGLSGPASILEDTAREWKRIATSIDGWQKTLTDRAEAISAVIETLDEHKTIWELTLSTADEVGLPPMVRREVEDVLRDLAEAKRAALANRDTVLTLQSRLATSGATVAEVQAELGDEIQRRRRGILGIDSPPLWRAFGLPGVDGLPSQQIAVIWTSNSRTVQHYISEQTRFVVRHCVLLIGLVMLLTALRRRADLWIRQDESLEGTVRLLDRPISASLVTTILFADLLYPSAPAAWFEVLGLVLLLSMLRILPLMVPDSLQPIAYIAALLYFLEEATHLAPDGNLVDRLLLLTLSSAAGMACWWVDRKLSREHLIPSESWFRIVRFGVRIALVTFVIGSLANIVGAVGFAALVIEATLNSVFSAILVWVAAVLTRAVVRIVLLTRAAKTFGIVRLRADEVRATLFTIITWVAVAVWIIWTLKKFTLYDGVRTWVGAKLDTAISFGEFSFVPGTVLLFVLMIWLTFKLSRLIQFGLETDVLPRMELPRGVPAAITRLTHYTVVVIGFVIAATAAGLDFSRINLIIGALGVGIGFGLQNVVNNFVSGLILLFERPIRVGDRVQLNQLAGVVTDIGMRASVVRTWQGADVIVPNANLISSEVINWTFSDDNHRIDVAVGVAYGTDPQAVIDLLESVAVKHPDVHHDPAPVALFLGFGDSSLDFELRAWAGTDFVQVGSDLRVAINAALVGAGIEIPFPQRDVHLRSVDAAVSGAAARIAPPTEPGTTDVSGKT